MPCQTTKKPSSFPFRPTSGTPLATFPHSACGMCSWRTTSSLWTRNKGNSQKKSQNSNKQKQNNTDSPTKQSITCFSCGRQGHRVYSPDCPAKQATCGLCHWVGHFNAFCHSKSAASSSGKSGGQKGGASGSNRCLHLSGHTSSDIKTTGSQSLSLNSPIFGTVQLDCRGFTSKFDLKAEVDSGSYCMVVTHSIFNSDFPNNVLYDLRCPVLNFDGSEINAIEGYFRTTASFNGQQCNASIYIMDDGCEPVIGRDLLTRLGMTVEFGLQTVCQTESVPSTQLSEESTHSSQHSPPNVNTNSDLNRGTAFCNKQVSSVCLNLSSPKLDQIPSLVESIIKQLPNLGSTEIGTYLDGQRGVRVLFSELTLCIHA